MKYIKKYLITVISIVIFILLIYEFQNIKSEVNNKSLDDYYSISMMKFGKLTKEQRIIDAYHFYTDMGFFKDTNFSNNEIVDKVLQTNDFSQYFDPFSSKEGNYYFIYGDLFILNLDNKRIWFKDTEMDVVQGNNAYVKALNEWSFISMKKFNPQNITEEWKSTEGPVTVSFTIENKKYKLDLTKESDFINMDIISQINKIIEKSGYRFETIGVDQRVCVVLLTIEEKDKIENERIIPFAH
ncbi:hypothetical protein [Paenibacillus sacheonensis]|uniref:Uncharacterized protein n=1 Tax=Paenibacillus sacheonensis TaxID=742054 RepID=A0A7X4YVY1_9BACL|nr:hypothetical protein [Paenibacillus sacheonensis]MBM7569523.1 hypothetical protein [Paenibacillus sacheonensis]NBC73582.1 hypothetical protein [Paenibacillus sacheonensis]